MATDPDARPLAGSQEIQGNILAPFRCDHQAFVFLGFGHRQSAARTWLAEVTDRVSSTMDVLDGRQTSYLNLGLTAPGLVVLRPEVAADLAGFEAFWNGPLGGRLDESGALTTTAALLGDVDESDPKAWLIGGPNRPPVDVVLTLAADDPDMLRIRVEEECARAESAGLVVIPIRGRDGGEERYQKGAILRDNERSVEHFGFADGISQPGIRGFTEAVTRNDRLESARRPGSPVIAAGEFIVGLPGERRPPTRTPRPEAAPWMRNGSFQVFRRLRQDVAGWRRKMEELKGDRTAADTAAMAVGRLYDGTPLAPNANPRQPNDFTYLGDDSGVFTPLYAHIRKVNPRDDARFRDRSHKLLRRGVPFGPSYDEDPGAERGLLFNAYMTSIEDQFEFLQRRWANDPTFPTRALSQQTDAAPTVDGLDPVLGDNEAVARQRLGDQVADVIPPLAFGGFVTTTGALYAFAPSRATLSLLSGNTWLGGR